MRCCGEGVHGDRARADRGALARRAVEPGGARSDELDLDPRRGAVLVRPAARRPPREVGMDDWGFEQLEPWLQARRSLPVGPLFCVIS
jgi:hypothetical protein